MTHPSKQKKLVKALSMALALGIGAVASMPASATLLLNGAWQGAALSIDGWGGNTNANGMLLADTPFGSEVLQAYLYAPSVWGGGTSNVSLAGNLLNTTAATTLTPDVNQATTLRWDVTSIMRPLIEGTNGLQSFAYKEAGEMDGGVLVIVYKNASTANGTAIIMDGELATTGDTTTLTFASPYVGGDVIMSLASSFSFNGNGNTNATGQVTTIDVITSSTASRRLSGCAGGNDDANFLQANGALITVGGIGDSATNPDPLCAGGAGDDELYNLALGNSADATPFLQAGDSSVTLNTLNPSNDDNVFFMGFTSSFKVSQVNDDDIDDDNNNVPEPGVLSLMGLGLLGAYGVHRRRKA